MSEVTWVRFFPSDWLAGTRGMTAAESGIYITLIAMMYERGGSILYDASRLARLCGASNSAFKKAVATLIEDGKIILEDGYLSNNRVVEELFYSREKSTVAKRAAESRWGEKSNKNNGGDDADALRTHCGRNAIQNQNQNNTTLLERARDIDARMPELYQAAGITDETKSPGLLVMSEPIRWVEAGCDIDLDIIPSLRAIAARGKQIRSWAYCSSAVFEARDRRLSPPPTPRAGRSTAPPREEDGFLKAIREDLEKAKRHETTDHNSTSDPGKCIDAGITRDDQSGAEIVDIFASAAGGR